MESEGDNDIENDVVDVASNGKCIFCSQFKASLILVINFSVKS